MDTEQSENELATFTSEGHKFFMDKIESNAGDGEPTTPAKSSRRRPRRRKPSQQEMAKAVHFELEKDLMNSIPEVDDTQSVKSDTATFLNDPIDLHQNIWEQKRQTDPSIFSYFSEPTQFRHGIYQPNAFTRDFDQ